MNDMSVSLSKEEQLIQRRLENLRVALGSRVLAALKDPDVVEIMLNDDGKLWIEKNGDMNCVGEISANDGMTILRLVATAVDKELTKENPIISGELPLDGSRFEGVAPPVVERPIFAIRKMAQRIYTMSEYVKNGVLTFRQSEVLRQAIIDEKNILVIGGKGSGKTTFLNALLHQLSIECPDVRMVIMQDTRELQCSLENRLFLRTTEWTTFRMLAKTTNRLRPSRVTVGEMRDGAAALELLKIWNSGDPGGMATIHANSAYEGLTRLDQLIQEVSASPQLVLIGEAVDYCVFMKRTRNGRKIEEIVKVIAYDPSLQKFIVEKIG